MKRISRSGLKNSIQSLFKWSAVCVCLSRSAQAAESSPVGVNRYDRSEIPGKSYGPIRAKGDVQYEYTQYFTPVQDRPELNQSQLMQANLQADLETSQTKSHLDFSAGRYMDIHNSFFSVQELYWSGITDQPVQVSIGRRLENWSAVDQDWQLGLWQPQAYNVDRLRPLDQGLTGIFVEGRTGNWNFLAYGSPIIIPSTDPDVSEKHGDVVPDTRWGASTPSSGSVLETNTRFVYTITVPQIERLISHPGGGARVRYGGKTGPFASANYAYKPMNSLFFKIDYNLRLDQERTVDIEVSPDILYHHLYGADAGWNFKKGRVSVSFLRDEPVAETPENDVDGSGNPTTDWVRQNPGRLTVYAFHGETELNVPMLRDPLLVDFDYLKGEDELTREWDQWGRDRGAVIDPNRLDFTNAAMIKTTMTSRLWGRRLASSLRYLREFEQNGSIWSLCEEYSPARDWAVRLGFDILGVDDDSDANTNQRFLNTFRANDRIYGGLSYVF